jgi:multiple RNA-binding domain-containing protein 1
MCVVFVSPPLPSLNLLQSDAVLSSIADRMEISKADVLNPESDNAAVKLALAETHVINETKAYLESQGIILSAFSSRVRSDTIILVKNIPYGTSASQIRELFEPHGELNRVVVPPAGTIAVVEFLDAHEAKKAFTALAYRRLKNYVIFLEMGPIGMFKDVDEAPPDGQEARIASRPLAIANHEDDDQEDSLVGGTTLYLKNLSFSTTTERLTQVFHALPGFAFARVQTKTDHRRPGGPKLSMGYGFLGFKTVDAAKKACKGLKGYVLDGHALRAEFAGRGREEEEAAAQLKGKEVAKGKTTKMIVKNVPFEATKKDIRELFG